MDKLRRFAELANRIFKCQHYRPDTKSTPQRCTREQALIALISIAVLGAPYPAIAQTVHRFEHTGAIVDWTVPVAGTYRIVAIGAQGAAGNPSFSGGRGAQIEGKFEFSEGQRLQIAVGGAGTATSSNNSGSGGGGGGTFLVDENDNPLLIAGGGGGTRSFSSQDGTDASITERGWSGSGNLETYTPVPAANDGAGGAAPRHGWGSAGAGFFGDGADDAPLGTGGRSWANGMTGGVKTGSCAGAPAFGGFGGGGSGDGCFGGGGGGGYSGGDGGRVAGGGGSFNSGANPAAIAGVGVGNGSLTITLLSELKTEESTPVETTTALISDFQQVRGQMIVANGPKTNRRIGRLRGERRSDGGVFVEGAALRNSALPLRLELSSGRTSFSFSTRDTVAGSTELDFKLPRPGQPEADNDGTTPSDNVGNAQQGNVANHDASSQGIVARAKNAISATPVIRDSSPWEFWTEGTIAEMQFRGRDGNFTILHVGLDYLVTPDVLLGFSLQYDRASLSGTSDRIDGEGYMVGPYVTARLWDNLYFDGRLAWGESDNTVSPFGTYSDDYDSERKLVTAALIGDYALGDAITFSPEARLSWYETKSDAYVDSQNIDIPSVTTSFGSLELTPTLSHSFELSEGILTAQVGASTIWAFDVDTDGASGELIEGARGRVELGAEYSSQSNYLLSSSVFYDGIGQSGFNFWGLTLELDVRF